MDTNQPIHLVLGESAAGTIRLALAKGNLCPLRDELSVGPHTLDAQRARQVRNTWWATHYPEDAPPTDAASEDESTSLGEHDWQGIAESGAVIWYGGGTGEQLHLCWAAHHLALHQCEQLAIAQPPTPSQLPAMMIGASSPEALAQSLVSALSAPVFEQAAALWRAFCEPSPSTFHHLAIRCHQAEDPAARALLGDLHLLMHRLPHPDDGLSIWDRKLLQRLAAHPGEQTARTIGFVMADAMYDTADHLGDRVLFGRLKELVHAGALTQEGPGTAIRDTTFALTSEGTDLASGHIHRLSMAPFQRWFGGTELNSDKTVWCFDGEALTETNSW